MSFNCTMCGLCCTHIDRLQNDASFKEQREAFPYKNDNGICEKYDRVEKKCTIYETRPEICRVNEMFRHWPKKELGIENFYRLNEQACRNLQSEELRRTV